MRILLDTRVLIWWDEGARLHPEAKRAIGEADQVYVSAVSAWEIAIKTLLGRLPKHHMDPFDRMLAAQALAEGLTLVTRDAAFRPYRLRVVRA